MKRNRDGQSAEERLPSQFDLRNVGKFEGNFPSFQMPRCVGYFSLDDHRNYRSDASQLRYLKLPGQSQTNWKVRFDLRKGIDDVIEKNEEQMRNHMLDDMLRWVLQERKAKQSYIINVTEPLRPLEIDFLCFRGLLTLIACSPYEKREPWSILVTKFQKTIFLWQLKGEDNTRNNPRLHEMTLWGFKFEQYLCASSPNEEPNAETQLNTNPEFCCVVKTKLGQRSLLYGAEVDAVSKSDSKPPWGNLEDFVELKTTRIIETQRQDASFRRFKLLKWWAQSFLVGVPAIVCGYRDDDGLVTKLEWFPVQKLPSMSKGDWNPTVCMNFCQEFLNFVGQSVSAAPADGGHHFIFQYEARRRVIDVRRVPAGELPRPLLPSWFLEEMKKPV